MRFNAVSLEKSKDHGMGSHSQSCRLFFGHGVPALVLVADEKD